MSTIETIFVIICVIAILYWISRERNKEGKIKDNSLYYPENFLKELRKLEIKGIPDKKQGFTEKDVQDQLEKFFKKHFETVYREYALEGVNVNRIDFDLGKGRIGVEIKLAREIIKESSWKIALGQAFKYVKKKYKEDNLIFLIAGTEDERDNQKIKEFVSDLKSIGCIHAYIIMKKE
jgi:hypothetical protein